MVSERQLRRLGTDVTQSLCKQREILYLNEARTQALNLAELNYSCKKLLIQVGAGCKAKAACH